MDQQMQQQIHQESLFHKRASIVITDVLEQVGLTQTKLNMVVSIVETIKNLPPFVFIALGKDGEKIKDALNDIDPLLAIAKQQNDPSYFLKAVPEEKMLYFINQVITRLEWVKDGNEKEITNYAEVTVVKESECGHTSE